jgi:putative hydrolase of the HAD superfamily
MSKVKLDKSAAIFDFDGTLVDSYTPRKNTNKKVATFLLKPLGIQNSPTNERTLFQIVSKIDIEMHQNKIYDRNLWWKEAARRYFHKLKDITESTLTEASTLYWESLKKKSTVYPGVKSTLRALRHRGIKLGLVSDTDGLKGMKTERIEASGLREFFDVTVVSGEETVEVKPHPEPFALISKRLGIPAERCISVGDNPETDVDGGLRLGMKVVIIRSKETRKEKGSQPYYLVDRRRLRDLIIRLLEQGK